MAALFFAIDAFLGESCYSLLKSASLLGGSNSGIGLKNSSLFSIFSFNFVYQYSDSKISPSSVSTKSICRYLFSSSNLQITTFSKLGALMKSARIVLILKSQSTFTLSLYKLGILFFLSHPTIYMSMLTFFSLLWESNSFCCLYSLHALYINCCNALWFLPYSLYFNASDSRTSSVVKF